MGELILPPAKTAGANMITKITDRITGILPATVEARQFCVAALVEANKLPDDTDPASVAVAAFNCATIGWIPGSALGHAFFIPFNDRKQGKRICQLVPGYKGFLDLAYGNNFLKDVHCNVVLRDEEFEFWVDTNGPQLRHRPALDRNLRKENVVGCYTVYHTVSGGHGIKVVNRRELDKADTGKNVWRDDYIAMALKTPLRRAAKEWRITHRLGLAIQLDEQAERGEPQNADIVLDGMQIPEAKKPVSLDTLEEPNGEPE